MNPCFVFLDVSKAFVTVRHFKDLLRKLELSGFRGPFLGSLKPYKKDRKQFVSMGNFYYLTRAIKRCNSHGSVPGPNPFKIDINDLPLVYKSCNMSLFANDTSFY